LTKVGSLISKARPISQADPAIRSDPTVQVLERRVEVDSGVSLATWTIDGRSQVDREGSDTARSTFLLVHGLASNARLWDYTALELARLGHLVSAVDLRGHGESDKPDHGYDFETLTSDIVKVSKLLELDRPILAGQSLGANLVLETAWQHPAISSGIVCVDGGTIELSRAFPKWEDAAKVLAPPVLAGMKRDVIFEMMREGHRNWPESGIESSMANFEVRSDGTVAAWLSRENHMKILRGLWEHKPSTRFATLDVPALLIFAGAHGSGPFDKRESARLAETTIPKVRVVWFEDADHDIHAQYPIELADLLDRQVADGFFS
jgi:pimeloyl-ACP methyl ester carboxylesterase